MKPLRQFLAWAVFGVLVTGGLISCASKTSPEQDFQQEAERLERRTVPSDGIIVNRSGPVQNNWTVSASWEVETKLTQADYTKWMVEQLQPEFKTAKKDDSLTLFKHEGNDTQTIECRFTTVNENLRAHFGFSSRPD